MATTAKTQLRRVGALLTRSLPLGTWLGVPMRAHWSLWWVVAGFALWGASGLVTGDVGRAVGGVVWLAVIAVVALSIILHEYGHVRAGQHLGFGTREVILTPIGGLAAMRAVPTSWRGELFVALAGPAVTLALWGAAALALVFLPDPALAAQPSLAWSVASDVLRMTATINKLIFLFNLAPVLPMDGGRVLRALLSWRLGIVRATTIASRVAYALIAVALVAAFATDRVGTLPFVALLIGMAARGEEQRSVTARRLDGLTAADFLLPLYPGDPALLAGARAPRVALSRSAPELYFDLRGGPLSEAGHVLVVDERGTPVGRLNGARLVLAATPPRQGATPSGPFGR